MEASNEDSGERNDNPLSLVNNNFALAIIPHPAENVEFETRYRRNAGLDEAGDLVVQETREGSSKGEVVYADKRVKRSCTNSSGYQTTTTVDWENGGSLGARKERKFDTVSTVVSTETKWVFIILWHVLNQV